MHVLSWRFSSYFIQYCFDPEPAITIKHIADSLIPSYRQTVPIMGYEKPTDENQPILGFSIRVKNVTGYEVVEYDFGLEFREDFSPGQNMHLRKVLWVFQHKSL